MNGVQTRFKCKLDVKRCKRFVFPPSSLLPRSNALKTKAIRYFQTDRTLTRIVSPPLNRAWHEANRTYTFSYGLGALIMSIGILVFLGIFFPKVGLAGDTLAIIMTLGTLSFLVTTPEVWVPDLGSGEFGFPLLSGAGRLVIKDIVILASAVVLLSDSSQRVLKTLKKD